MQDADIDPLISAKFQHNFLLAVLSFSIDSSLTLPLFKNT